MYPLTNDLLKPNSDGIGQSIFSKGDHLISISVFRNAIAEQMIVTFNLSPVNAPAQFREMERIVISKSGRNGRMLNKTDVDEYELQRTEVNGRLKSLQSDRAAFLSDKKVKMTSVELEEKKKDFETQIQNTIIEQSGLTPVTPEYETIDRYADCIDIIDSNCMLTESGKVWASQIDVSGKPLTFYIE